MLYNYLKIALRNLRKHKSFSAINLLGLSFSMSVCLLIITIINDQLTYDTFHTKGDRIYRVITDLREKDGGSYFKYATTVNPIADALKNDFPGVAEVVRISKSLYGDARSNEKQMPVSGIFADESLLSVFSFELKSGDPITALSEPYTVLLSESTAEKFFADQDPVGYTMEIGNRGTFKITGVIKNTPAKSHIRFDVVGSLTTMPMLEKTGVLPEKVINNWENPYSTYVYILLEEGTEASTIQHHLNQISDEHAKSRQEIFFAFHMQKLSEITPSKLMNNVFSATMPIEAIIALVILASIIILSACFNYTNLSIARALTRAKEVGIRKVTGAKRFQLVIQFLSESVLFSVISLVLAVIMHNYFLEAFNQLHIAQEISMRFDENISTYVIFIIFSIATGIIAGIAPALLLSSFRPIRVLKNLSGAKLFSRLTLRKALIVAQFTFSLFFIITTIVIQKQSGLLIKSEYGFTKENIINVRLQGADAQQFLNEVRKRSDVVQASVSSHIPATGSSYGATVRKNVDDEYMRIDYFSVDHQYIDNLDLKLIAGRNFPPNISDQNEQFIILNEKATKLLNYENAHDAVGQDIYLGVSDSTMVQIIGVVKDYNFRSKLMGIQGMALRYKPEEFRHANVKIDGQNTMATIAALEQEWKKLDPAHTFEFGFFDQQLEDAYGFLVDLRSIIGVTAILAIIIASLGLLGMAIYNAESRIKEVGIRKVLGAEIHTIFFHLSKGYFLLLVIAAIIATPLALFANNLWLQEAATKITLGPAIMFSGVFILFAIGLLTVGSQSIRAALTKPVDSLRSE